MKKRREKKVETKTGMKDRIVEMVWADVTQAIFLPDFESGEILSETERLPKRERESLK